MENIHYTMDYGNTSNIKRFHAHAFHNALYWFRKSDKVLNSSTVTRWKAPLTTCQVCWVVCFTAGSGINTAKRCSFPTLISGLYVTKPYNIAVTENGYHKVPGFYESLDDNWSYTNKIQLALELQLQTTISFTK